MKKISLKVIAGIIVVAILVVAVIWWKRSTTIVPPSIANQASFVIFYPANGSQITIQKTSFKYDNTNKQVSFIVAYQGQSITFGEQSSPDSFSDDQNFYPQFIQSLNGYSTFSSANGSVDLTKPTETNHETGVMNSKGTLLFAQDTTGNLSENAWKQLFNALIFIQPK